MEPNNPPTETVYLVYDLVKQQLKYATHGAPYVSLTRARLAAQELPRGKAEVWEYQLTPVQKLPVKPGRYEEV